MFYIHSIMTIELISFRYNLIARKRRELAAELINSSNADLVVFCGHALKTQDDLYAFEEMIKNKSTCVLFEVAHVKESKFVNLQNCLYTVENDNIHNLFTSQMFSTKEQIENSEPLCERYINELETRRCFSVKGKKCLVLQCGEINILQNLQSDNNRVIFRHPQRADLEERFFNLVNSTDIILNPIHTPMGNQGKMKKRREFFSSNKRYYFSVSQNGTRKWRENYYEISIDSNSLQYAFYDGNEIEEFSREVTTDYQKRTFQI
jgi:hypothetical protein